MDNASTEISLLEHPELAIRMTYHQAVVLSTKERLDTDKPILVINIPPFKFAGGPTKKGRREKTRELSIQIDQ